MSAVLRTAATVVGAAALIVGGIATANPGLVIAGAKIGTIAAVTSAAAVALSVGAQLTAKKPSAQPAAGDPTKFYADKNAPIPYIIGRTQSSGNIIHRQTFDALGTSDNAFQTIFAVWGGGGPYHRLEAFKIDGVTVDFAVDPVAASAPAEATGSFHGNMFLQAQLGRTPEPIALKALDITPYPAGWSAQSKLSGYAAFSWLLRWDPQGKKFPTGVPQPAAVIEGGLVYDMRQDSTYPGGSGPCRAGDESTYVWEGIDPTKPAGKNPWLHALTWAIGRWQNGKRILGIGMTLGAIDVAAFAYAANVADANDWTIGGAVDSSAGKLDVLRKMCAAGGGAPLQLGGTLSCEVDAPRVSLATITDDQIIGDASVIATPTISERINGVIPSCRLEDHDWSIVPCDKVQIGAYVADDGREKTKAITWELVQDADQVAELATYAICNAREFGPIVTPLKLRWIGYRPGDCLTITSGNLGMAAQPVVVRNRHLDPSSGAVTLTMRSETIEKHAYSLGQTTTPPPTPGLQVIDPSSLLVPGINASYGDGTPIEVLKPAEPGATAGSPSGTLVGNKTADEVAAAAGQVAAIWEALENTDLGDTAAAHESRVAAEAARDAAATSANNAATARDQAQGAYTAAGDARAEAINAKNLASSFAGDAGAAAAAASGSASIASTSATAAGNSASSASGFANTAQVKASEASTSAGYAAGSASSAATSSSAAAGSATAAGISASSATSSEVSARLGAAQALPSGFSPSERKFWVNGLDGVDPAVAANAYFGDQYFGPAAYPVWVSPSGETNVISSLGVITPIVGHTYRLAADFARVSEDGTGRVSFVHLDFIAKRPDGSIVLFGYGVNGRLLPRDTFVHRDFEWLCNENFVWVKARMHFNWDNAGSGFYSDFGYHLKALSSVDVTAEKAAAAQASAAASSASSAAASQTAAGNLASSANVSATGAATSAGAAAGSAGQASTSASEASTSASNAAGSASTASSYATQAAVARDTAGGQAAAAATSASNASGYATQAGSSATAAQSASVAAQGYSTSASSAAGAASSSAATASGNAAAAQQAATVSASVSGNVLNANPSFLAYFTPDGVPSGWADWNYGWRATRSSGPAGGYAYRVVTNANEEQGLVQTFYASAGPYFLEMHGWLEAGSWQGSGMFLQRQDNGASFGVVNCATMKSDDGYVGGGAAGIRRWSIAIDVPTSGLVNLYAMTNWEGFNPRPAKTLNWYRAALVPASSAEAAVQSKASIAQLNAVAASAESARASTQTTLEAAIGGQSITLQELAGVRADANGFRRGIWGVSFNGGRPTISAYYTDANGQIQQGVYIGGNLYVEGDALIAGSVATGKLGFGTSGQASLWINGPAATWNRTDAEGEFARLQLESDQGQPIKGHLTFRLSSDGGDTLVRFVVRRDDGTPLNPGPDGGGIVLKATNGGVMQTIEFVDNVAAGRSTTWTWHCRKESDTTAIRIDGMIGTVDELSRTTWQHASITIADGTGPGAGSGGVANTGGGNLNGGGGGFFCPHVDEWVLLANETRDGPGVAIRAGDVRYGMMLWTIPDGGTEWGAYPIDYVGFVESDLWMSGAMPLTSGPHLWDMDGTWTRMDAIGQPAGRRGQVVALHVRHAQTYVLVARDGRWWRSHNKQVTYD